MQTALTTFIAAPRRGDPHWDRRATIVHSVLLSMIAGAIVGIPLAVWLRGPLEASVLAISVLAGFMMIWVHKRGSTLLVAVTLPLLGNAVVTMLTVRGVGAHDINAFGYPLMVALAALLLGEDWPGLFWGMVGVSILCFSGAHWLEVNGMTLASADFIARATPERLFLFGFFLILTAMLMRLMITNLMTIIDHQQQTQAKLEGQSLALQEAVTLAQTLNQTLERRVDERTRDLEAARHEAERANKVKSAFLATMSHELRTPMNAIINFTSFVANGDVGPINDEQHSMLIEVEKSSKHLLELINQVLDMSKIESGSLMLFTEANINVAAIIDSAVVTARGLLMGKPVDLQIEVAPTLPAIQADRQRLLQILLNLLSNACKFTDEGVIRVHAEADADGIEITISDTGPGIAEAELRYVFEPFRQTETGMRRGGGTGLGLPICKRLIEAHGGTIHIDSTVGRGTTFTVRLPSIIRNSPVPIVEKTAVS